MAKTEQVQPETIMVRSTNIHSMEYQAWRVVRLYRAAGVAYVADILFSKHMGRRPGDAQITYEGKSTAVRLTENYVSSLKRLAYQEYLALHDIKPEGPKMAKDVLDQLKGIDREPALIEDHIDDVDEEVKH